MRCDPSCSLLKKLFVCSDCRTGKGGPSSTDNSGFMFHYMAYIVQGITLLYHAVGGPEKMFPDLSKKSAESYHTHPGGGLSSVMR